MGQFAVKIVGQFAVKIVGQLTPKMLDQDGRFFQYTIEGDSYSARPSIFPLLDTKHQNNNTTIEMHATFVEFTHNAKKYIGGPIDKDQISTHVRLLQKKTTFIYYNQANPADYFFDLSFMYEE